MGKQSGKIPEKLENSWVVKWEPWFRGPVVFLVLAPNPKECTKLKGFSWQLLKLSIDRNIFLAGVWQIMLRGQENITEITYCGRYLMWFDFCLLIHLRQFFHVFIKFNSRKVAKSVWSLSLCLCAVTTIWNVKSYLLVSTYVVCERLLWCTSRFLAEQ